MSLSRAPRSSLHNQQTNRSLETKTNRKGEYIQVGLSPGQYTVTASKDDLTTRVDVDIHLDMAVHDFKLARPASGATVSKEAAAAAKAKAEPATKALQRRASRSATRARTTRRSRSSTRCIAAIPNCAECYANIGTVQTRAKKYDEAEAAFKKAIELKPDFAEAYNGLANLYNTQKKFDQAAEAEQEGDGAARGRARRRGRRGGGASASAVFNQGVILWNAGKIPEAKSPVRAGREARSEPGRSALLARHGAAEWRQPAGPRSRSSRRT